MGNAISVGKTSTAIDTFEADYTTRNDRWLTPLPLIRALGRFDLDPCGAPHHPTAETIWTPELIGDGLSMPWHGRVWLNPPYGRTMPDWMRALAEHGTGTALIFARTETAMWHQYVWPHASAILFLRGRLTFLEPDGGKPVANSGAASVLVAYGQEDRDALAASGLAGHLVDLREIAQ